MVDPDLDRAAEKIKAANAAVALTGAGISTPSGIPDFRSARSGLWRKHDPMEVASLTSFRYHPERFFDWVRPLANDILRAEPNAAHLALARLEMAGMLAGVVTQNIDDLHRRAGSQTIHELHGHLREATCVRCYRRHPNTEHLRKFAMSGEIPRCPECGGILKPEVVLFGEQLPYFVVENARTLIDAADLILVIGSSLEVTPASIFPVQAVNRGANLIIINRTPTYLDDRADLIFRQDVSRVLPQIVDRVFDD